MSVAVWLGIYAVGWLVTAVIAARSWDGPSGRVEFADAAVGCFTAVIWPLIVLVLPVLALVSRRAR